ncbi:unnamed protein product [Sphagnum jensenii]|uniref:Uncharacterized protein n=1 Tax=Sphagnum jensenii TaxID=128206 RepID=A0ABP1BDQ4_9BRYO
MEDGSIRATLERNLSMPGAQKQSKAWPYDEHQRRIASAASPILPSSANRNASDSVVQPIPQPYYHHYSSRNAPKMIA